MQCKHFPENKNTPPRSRTRVRHRSLRHKPSRVEINRSAGGGRGAPRAKTRLWPCSWCWNAGEPRGRQRALGLGQFQEPEGLVGTQREGGKLPGGAKGPSFTRGTSLPTQTQPEGEPGGSQRRPQSGRRWNGAVGKPKLLKEGAGMF